MSTTDHKDLAEGGAKMTGTTAEQQATGTVALTLTSSTGKTITVKGAVFNVRLGVNRRTGLNTISGDVLGEVTASA